MPAAESAVAESAYGAAAATSSLPSSSSAEEARNGSSSSGGTNGGGDEGGSNGSSGVKDANETTDTQEAAYSRMQAVLAAANPTARLLEDPSEGPSSSCLTPSPGTIVLIWACLTTPQAHVCHRLMPFVHQDFRLQALVCIADFADPCFSLCRIQLTAAQQRGPRRACG